MLSRPSLGARNDLVFVMRAVGEERRPSSETCLCLGFPFDEHIFTNCNVAGGFGLEELIYLPFKMTNKRSTKKLEAWVEYTAKPSICQRFAIRGSFEFPKGPLRLPSLPSSLSLSLLPAPLSVTQPPPPPGLPPVILSICLSSGNTNANASNALHSTRRVARWPCYHSYRIASRFFLTWFRGLTS